MNRYLFLVLFFLSSNAMASDLWGPNGLIFSPGVIFGQFESQDSSTATPNSLSLSFAKPFTHWFSLRLDYTNGVSGGESSFEGEDFKAEVDRIWSGFAKFNYGSEWSQYYLLAGVSQADFFAGQKNEPTYEYTQISPSFGVGASMKIEKKTMMALEYVSYMTGGMGGDVNFSAFGVRFEQAF